MPVFFKKFLSYLFLISCIISIHTFIFAYEVDMKADSITYQQENGIVTASGNVKLDWLGRIVEADNIEMKISEQQLSADGNVVISESSNTIYSDKITYEMQNEHGEMFNTLAYASPVFLRAEKMVRESSNTYRIENVTISNCDLDNAHHHIYAKEGVFVIAEKISVSKAIYYIGKVPVFYFPKFTKHLKGGSDRFTYKIEPGYSNEGGISAKVKLNYKFSKHFNTSLLLDYLGQIGEGLGLEANYLDDNVKATLYTYGAKYEINDSQRWIVRPSYWHKINDYWTIQSHGEFVSDSYFNNKYSLDNWNRVLTERKSYFSATRNTNKSVLRMISELYQLYNPETDKLQNGSYLKLPEFYYSRYPFKTLGFYNNFSFKFQNRYNYEYKYLNKTYDYNYVNANADYNITKDYKVSKRLTVTPVLGVSEDYYNSRNPEDNNYSFVTRYYGTLNTRYRPARWMDWNFAYEAKIRTESNNLLAIDESQYDKGFESNGIKFINYMYLSSAFVVRNTTGYDLRNLNDIKNVGFIDWYPLITEVTYTPSSKLTLYLKQQQNLHPFDFNSFVFDATIGQLEQFYLHLGAFYYATSPDEVSLLAGIGFWLNAKWRFDYLIRNRYSIHYSDFYGHDQEFRLYRDMHCFNLGATYIRREDYYELFFKFEMKSNVPTFTKRDGTKEIDQEFYPWR